jgi:hypothetical protein
MKRESEEFEEPEEELWTSDFDDEYLGEEVFPIHYIVI